jgi:tellurite resistance protein TehA-like permease
VLAIPMRGVFDRMLASGAPEAGAEVMGTGIVSVALSLDGIETLSRILLAIAAAIWLTLALLVAARAARDPAWFRRQARTPAALSWVAGTAVVGARLVLLGWSGAGVVLLAGAAVLWASLIRPVLIHWRTPTSGASLLVTVATQSVAVLAAAVGVRTHASWLLVAALVPFVLGLGSYAFVMSRFEAGQLLSGRGDHWITGGALAISTLAAADIASGARTLAVLWQGTGPVRDLAGVLWVTSMLWLPVLVAAEALRPRLRHDLRRWSTVFPVGMYAACSFAVGDVAHAEAVTAFAQVWVWIALAVWAAVSAATVGSALRQEQPHRARSASARPDPFVRAVREGACHGSPNRREDSGHSPAP